MQYRVLLRHWSCGAGDVPGQYTFSDAAKGHVSKDGGKDWREGSLPEDGRSGSSGAVGAGAGARTPREVRETRAVRARELEELVGLETGRRRTRSEVSGANAVVAAVRGDASATHSPRSVALGESGYSPRLINQADDLDEYDERVSRMEAPQVMAPRLLHGPFLSVTLFARSLAFLLSHGQLFPYFVRLLVPGSQVAYNASHGS